MSNLSESLRSWTDILWMLFAEAETRRGLVSLLDSNPPVSFPRTTGRDALTIATVFDAAVRAHGPSNLVQSWIQELDSLSQETPATLNDTYIGNRTFWTTLVQAAHDLDGVHAALPSAGVVDAAMHQLATAREPRNSDDTMLITLFTAPTWRKMAERQLQMFRALRGEECANGPRVAIVPRTTNGDVVALARYWTEEVARSVRDSHDTCESHLWEAYSGWPEVARRVLSAAQEGPIGGKYPHNAEFWRALMKLASRDTGAHCPSPWAVNIPTLDDDDLAARNAAASLDPAHAPSDAHASSSIADALAGVMDRLVDVGTRSITRRVVRPVLYAGGAVAGAILLYLLVGAHKADCRS